MCAGLEGGTVDQSNEEEFAAYLNELKERGSTLLVVGELPTGCYDSFCSTMFGASTSRPRCRLTVTTGRSASVEPRVERDDPTSTSGISARHIISTLGTRRAAAATAATTGNDAVTHVDDGTSLSELGITISREIQEFEDRRGELDPAELRVCFDSLRPLIEEYGEAAVFRFLHVLNGRIRGVSGMGHFHLQVDVDDPLVDTFEEIFDAVIELRRRNERLAQRWHVRKRDFTSDWINI